MVTIFLLRTMPRLGLLVLMGIAAIAAVFSPAAAAKPKPPAIELSESGERLEQRYAEMLSSLQAELAAEIPAINAKARAAFDAARAAEREAADAVVSAEKKLGEAAAAKGLIGHAKNHWIPKAERGIAKAEADLRAAKTPAQRKAAEAELAKWKENRRAGLEALAERQAAFDEASRDEPARKQQVEQARAALEKAGNRLVAALEGLDLDRLLDSDRLDPRLAKLVVLREATPRGLAAFAQESDTHARLVDRLLSDGPLLVEMVVADGAVDGHYGRAMEIYEAILAANPRAKEAVLGRLALAIALEHATPIKQQNPKAVSDAPTTIDPLARYRHFERAYLAGELDPSFADRSTWELRFVVNGDEPDETLAWGREMLRNYRPDHITTKDDRWRYVAIVRTDVRYGSQENKNDKDDLQFFQNILTNGGVCGRRAFFGRFILRAFGVPTIARPQRGHAALAHATQDGWVVCLGAGWGSGFTKTRYGDDLNFLADAQARGLGARFMRVERARWIGDVAGEPRVYGFGGKTRPDFWNTVALIERDRLVQQAGTKILDAVGEELGEANESTVRYPFESPTVTEADRAIRVDQTGVITIPAAATSSPTKSTGKILFLDSVLGGKQLHYSRTGGDENFSYSVEVPQGGRYALSLRLVSPGQKQRIRLTVNESKTPIDIELPHTVGLWETTQPVTVTLEKGENTLEFSRQGVPQEVEVKGLSIKDLTLTPHSP